ncbi:hypothetical protein D9M70_463860 [compost metagenome]
MVIEAGGQVGDLGPRLVDLGGALYIGKAHQGIGVGDVEVLAHQHHAEGGVETLEEGAAQVGHAIAIDVPQQGDTVGAGYLGARLLHEPARHLGLDARRFVGTRRRAFGHQHIAIGQHVEPARMLQTLGEGVDLRAAGRHGKGALGPAGGGGDVDGGDEGLVRRRQLRVGTGAVLYPQGGLFAARRAKRQEGDGQQGMTRHVGCLQVVLSAFTWLGQAMMAIHPIVTINS